MEVSRARSKQSINKKRAGVVAWAMKPVPMRPASHLRMLVPVPAALRWSQLPDTAPRKAEDGQGLWAPSPMWETQLEFQVPGFSFTQLQLLQTSREYKTRQKISLLCHSVFQVNKMDLLRKH